MGFDDCIICRHSVMVSKYDLNSLKMNSELFKICKEHNIEVTQRIIELEKEEPKKYVIKVGPTKTGAVDRQVKERPDNDGSLIE